METLGWIVAVILALIFGPQILAAINAPVPFSQQNAIPGPVNGLPASSTQNQTTLNTANAPAPWHNYCNAVPVAVSPPSPSLPLAPSSITVMPATPVGTAMPAVNLYNAG